MKGKRLWFIIFAAALVISVITDLCIIGHAEAAEHWWMHIPGFFALFGFIGCIALIIVAKLAAHYWLQKKEDYYGKHDHAD